jgi:predicted metalloprotease
LDDVLVVTPVWGPRQHWQGLGAGPLPPPAPASRERNPLLAVLVAVAALAVLALAALAVVGLTRRPTVAPYQNDDYQPPPVVANPPAVPNPTSVAQAEQWIKQNSIYATAMPAPVRCEVARINPRTATDAELQAHLDAMVSCLLRDWDQPATKAGFVLVRPGIHIYGDRITTKCGDKGINAMYCDADQQIYYSRLVTTSIKGLADNPWATETVIAHEFGHAIQARTGIFLATYGLEEQTDDTHAQLLLNRRLENQADCFSGLFLRSVSRSIGLQQSDLDALLDIYVQLGSDKLSGKPGIESNHGLSASRRYWGQMGLANSDVGRCNTYLAAASLNR